MAAMRKSKKLKSDQFVGASGIVSLEEDSFSGFINEKDISLVMFYDPKGAYSNFSKPHYVKASKLAKKDVSYAAVNCESERRLCLAENIKDLPSIRIYSRGRLVSDQAVVNDYRKLVSQLQNVSVLAPKPVSKNLHSF